MDSPELRVHKRDCGDNIRMKENGGTSLHCRNSTIRCGDKQRFDDIGRGTFFRHHKLVRSSAGGENNFNR
jgi:hypothetical protein